MADVFNKNMEDIEVMEVSEASLLGETAATSGSCISCGSGTTSV